MGRKIVIVGGVATGPKAAARAKRRDPDAEITIVERGDVYSYAGCGMPFYIEGLVGDVDELLCTVGGIRRDEEYFRSVKDVEILGRTEAVKINRGSKTVTVGVLDGGGTRDIPYDKLVLATGASALVPRIAGIDLESVYRLYSPKDAEAIREKLDSGVSRVAVIGGGLIGMEVCGPIAARGCQVMVFEMMDRLVPALLDTDMSLLLEKYLIEQGVHVRTGSRVTRLIDDGSGRLSGVVAEDGSEFKADVALVVIGVRPNVELAQGAGLAIGETGAIAVNEFLQTSDPEIYAGGDCVENTCLITGRKVYVPLGSTANKHGRVIGDNVTGGKTTFPGVASTAVFKVLDFNVGKTGLNSAQAVKAGFDIVMSVAPKQDCAHYYPGAKPFIVKLIAEKYTGRILGAQVVGFGQGIKRIDVVATALRHGCDCKDLADIDLGYAPPYSTAIDPLAHAANIVRNKIEGLAHGISATELKSKLEGDGDFILLDVRSREEVEEKPFPDVRVRVIPSIELRERLGELPPDEEIVVFCRTSVRAYEAQRLMSHRGFRDVKFLDGSLDAWPYPL
ncbi:MAG: FAD-dependent oxidoreductase [Candidatus Bathyarchaeota archaeon]|nr:MAG: FAD-dependent oxidoreductase [Candidatus Bathyarchaeota archaeon]